MGLACRPVATARLFREQDLEEVVVAPALLPGTSEDRRAGLADVAKAEPMQQAGQVERQRWRLDRLEPGRQVAHEPEVVEDRLEVAVREATRLGGQTEGSIDRRCADEGGKLGRPADLRPDPRPIDAPVPAA